MNDLFTTDSTIAQVSATATPRERLLWVLRYEAHLSVPEIRTLHWRDLEPLVGGGKIPAAVVVAYRQSLGRKSFRTDPSAPVFASRKRGLGGKQVPINRRQLNHLLSGMSRMSS